VFQFTEVESDIDNVELQEVDDVEGQEKIYLQNIEIDDLYTPTDPAPIEAIEEAQSSSGIRSASTGLNRTGANTGELNRSTRGEVSINRAFRGMTGSKYSYVVTPGARTMECSMQTLCLCKDFYQVDLMLCMS
jgi:hypothetical protein